MGRKKIRMGFIENDRLRVITNAKRKKGLIKKAMELSLLCGSEILLIIHEKSLSRTVMYSSLQETSEELFTDVFVNKTATLSYSSEDVTCILKFSISLCSPKICPTKKALLA
eukprot:TRINITY_DN21_c0_g1_i4.p2 TRINITY_DN21_c0_g1~~TRINITY_DN21_c0_g1_i4.p2  ORF type:complete len:112 (-),score=31.28 TRINITY_DN21_c0_g1_i4:453-788(-)